MLSEQIISAVRLDSVVESAAHQTEGRSHFPSTVPTPPPSNTTTSSDAVPSLFAPCDDSSPLPIKLEQLDVSPRKISPSESNDPSTTLIPPPSPLSQSNSPLDDPPTTSSQSNSPMETLDQSSHSILTHSHPLSPQSTPMASSSDAEENPNELPMEQPQKNIAIAADGNESASSALSLSEEASFSTFSSATYSTANEDCNIRETSSSGIPRDEVIDDENEEEEETPTDGPSSPPSDKEEVDNQPAEKDESCSSSIAFVPQKRCSPRKQAKTIKRECVEGVEMEEDGAVPSTQPPLQSPLNYRLESTEKHAPMESMEIMMEDEGTRPIPPLRCSPRKKTKTIKKEPVDSDKKNDECLPSTISIPPSVNVNRKGVNLSASPIPQLRRSPRKREKNIEEEDICPDSRNDEILPINTEGSCPQRRRRSTRNSSMKEVKQQKIEMTSNEENPSGGWNEELDWKDVLPIRPRRSVKIEPREEDDVDQDFWSGKRISSECPRCNETVGKSARKGHFKQFHYDSFFLSLTLKMNEVERWVSCRIGSSSSGTKEGRVCLYCNSSEHLHDGRVPLLRHIKACHKSDFLQLKTAYRLYSRTRNIEDLPVHYIL
ncbi:hypothetical protein PMAYCL1PPCAC_29935, partial [Pristionchus mayeri]